MPTSMRISKMEVDSLCEGRERKELDSMKREDDDDERETRSYIFINALNNGREDDDYKQDGRYFFL